jgi:hypothetical protein
MTEKTIIYFHGYGSSPATDKVQTLKEHFSEVHAFPINIDPDFSLPYLEEEIDNLIVSNLNSEKELVFIGTSLGAWYAGQMASKFRLEGSRCVLINPAHSMESIKIDLPIPENIKEKYNHLGFICPLHTKFFIANNDEVIDFTNFHPKNATYVKEADHRFNGKPFENVIEYVKGL